MAEPDRAGVVIHGLRNEFTVDVSVNGLRRLSSSFAIDLVRVSRAAGQSADAEGDMAMWSSARRREPRVRTCVRPA